KRWAEAAAARASIAGTTLAGSFSSKLVVERTLSPRASRRTTAPRPMTGKPRCVCSKRTIVSPPNDAMSVVAYSRAEGAIVRTTARARGSAPVAATGTRPATMRGAALANDETRAADTKSDAEITRRMADLSGVFGGPDCRALEQARQ